MNKTLATQARGRKCDSRGPVACLQ